MYMERISDKLLFPQENILNVSHSPLFTSTWHKPWTFSKKSNAITSWISPLTLPTFISPCSLILWPTDDTEAKGWFPKMVFISTAATSVGFVTQLLYSDRTTTLRLVYPIHLLPPVSVNHSPKENDKIRCPHCYQPAMNINSGCILLVNSNQLFLCSFSKN